MTTTCLLAAANSDVWHSLADVLVLLATALLLGTLAERLRQSAIIGYIAAGTLVGPNLLGWVANQQDIFSLAELGVALLLFAIGLEFSMKRLLSLGRTPLLAGVLQVSCTLLAGFLIAMLCGLPKAESFVIGAMVALSSTACVMRMLNDRAELDSPHGRTALGILLVQDIAVVPLMLVVTALLEGGSATQVFAKLSISVMLAIALVATFYGLFNYVLPGLLKLRTLRQNRDLPILLAVITALGSAWAAHRLSLSPALGAFVAGVLLAISPFATQIRADVQPLKTVLVTLFFAAVGMFADLAWLVENLLLVAAVVTVIVIGKFLLVWWLSWLCGQPWQFAIGTGLCLAQVGEFSFVLATVAVGGAGAEGLLSETTFRAIVSATIVSLLMTPYLVQFAPVAPGVVRRLVARMSRQQAARLDAPTSNAADSTKEGEGLHGQPVSILLIGFGPAGQRVAGELMQAGIRSIAVVDLNHDNLQIAQRFGLETHVGDATQLEVLEHAGIYDCELVILTVPSPTVSRQLIHLIRQMSPGTLIFVRCRYHLHHWLLLSAGAHVIVDEEEHVGERLAVHVLAAHQAARLSNEPLAAPAD